MKPSGIRQFTLRARRSWLGLGGLALATALVAPGSARAQGQGAIPWPSPDVWLETKDVQAYAQQQSAWRFEVFHDFGFTNHQAESGITFHHRIVDDAGRDYKAVQYDHGNGLAAADVDGDGKVDLYFVNQLGASELWKNLGGGKFQNVTEAAGVAIPDRIKVTASFADIDNDGDPDLFVTSVRGGNLLFTNDGKGHFKDVTAQSGLALVAHSSGATFFDYDRDGKLDLFVSNVGKYTSEVKGPGGYYIGYVDAFAGHLHPERTELSVLYHNDGGGHFTNVTDQTGLFDGSWTGDSTITDFNDDGFPDLYVLNMMGDDHAWENVGGQRFVDKTATYFPKTPWGAMGIKRFDWDNDGKLDLLITDMHSDMSREVVPGLEKVKSLPTWKDDFLQGGANNLFGSAFYRGLGGGKFEEISERNGVETYCPWGPSVGDVNADGFQDVFVAAGMGFPFRYEMNSLLLNNRGKTFLDSEFLLGIEPRQGAPRRPWFEVDCSGADQARPLCRGVTGQHWVESAPSSRSAVLFDLDDDGDLDLVTLEFNDVPQVLVSDLAQKRPIHWLKVKLVGTASNRDALGSTVQVFAGGATYTQANDGKSGYLSQSQVPLYFGLGDADKVDRVEVAWPSGRKQTVRKGLETNRLLTITEE